MKAPAFMALGVIVVTFVGLAPAPAAAAAASPAPATLQAGPAVDYAGLAFYPKRWQDRGLSTQLHPWPGERVIFFTTRTNFDSAVMARFVGRLDRAWKLYADLTGRSPNAFKQFDGKPVIAAVPDAGLTCGYGCGYVGATGIEVGGFYDGDYPLFAAKTNAFPHYYCYEMGRNYYTFGDRHSLFVTGYAVFMRYVCMDALGCDDADLKTRKIIEEAEALHAKADLDFLRAFTSVAGLDEKAPRLRRPDGKPLQPSDQPVLYASAMLKLRRDCGGDAWVKRFFAELVKCPKIKPDTRDAALRQSLNWFVAASCAAQRDLSDVFVDRWRFPLAREARQALAQVKWTSPEADAVSVLKALPATMAEAGK
ncbi:MAG: calcium-binding protein [Verrucomicrobia bacterium]|nr:calcium-binding protein [Verrucomicrobiota bacterium]